MIKRGKSEVLRHTFYVDDTVADAGTVTVTVTDEADTQVFTGSAIKTGNEYSFTLPGQATLGRLAIEWNGSLLDDTSAEEVIGSYLFELAELREIFVARDFKKAYSNSLLRDIRDQVTETFESVANLSFVERRKTVRVSVVAGQAFLPVVAVRQVLTVDGESFTGDFTPNGWVDGLTGSSATVTYEHGLDGGVTAEAKGMALELAVHLTGAQAKKTPDNAEQLTDATTGNTYRLSLVGTRGIEVPVPRVDAFLKRIKFDVPGVA
ncbi:hypothetical protein [Amycolatopsis sp. lyj-112]|uniref:hypothetical protein n=1 Tax=Amycolatopsis sp. lyj-112 TaxID=2789288 RepID=UPI00397CE80A